MSTATVPIIEDRPAQERRSRELLSRAHLVLPGAVTAFLCFRAGGFFPGITGLATVAVATALLLRVTLAADPFAGWTRAAAGAALAGACFASWTLASALWSGATARALVEFDRALLYVLLLALLATVPRGRTSVTVLLRWVLAAFAVVALAGLASRLAPGVFPISGRFIAERLSFPLTYWNATGIAAALGTVLALHHASGEQEPRWVRVAATAALPGLITALYFTFSRGAIAAGAIGVIAYAVLAHPRRLPFALAAALPPSIAAVVAAYGADALATERYFAGDGPGEGRALALILAGLTLAAGGIRVALEGVEQRARSVVLRRWTFLAAGGAAVLIAVALDAPGRVDRELDAFRSGNVVPVTGDARDRLTQVGNNGRLDFWDASLSAFKAEPLRGGGAGTYRLAWQRERPNATTVNDGHSLYLEVLAELGLVGLLLLAATLLVPVVVAATRLRGPERHAHAAFLAAAAVLLIHAGVDWDWEMPALWVWFFATAGVVVAGPGGRAAAPARVTRVVVGLGCLLLAATPALVVASQPALSESRRAFVRGDCGTAVDRALASLENLRVWPEAYEILGYCNLRGGEEDLALRSMHAAHDRDPRDWQFAYGLAIAQAFAGEDPRPAAALAARLNPNEELATELSRRLRAADRERWPRVAARARIPQR
jgi:O-Antigen ligase